MQIHGLKWFINNVLESVNIKLQIIGSGMEALKKGTKPLFSGINGETSDIATAAGIFAVYQSVHK